MSKQDTTYTFSGYAQHPQQRANTACRLLEREIDQLVYKLYDLTPEEIAIVEETTRGK